MANQNITFNVYEFDTVNHITFNYKLYKRTTALSYRQGEQQHIPEDLNVWPNNPVDISHTLIYSANNVHSPNIVSLVENETYFIKIWKNGYVPLEKQFFIADSADYNYDESLVGNYPSTITIELTPMTNGIIYLEPGKIYTKCFETSDPITSQARDADFLPVGIFVVNGIDTSTLVTVVHKSTGSYYCEFTVPYGLNLGDQVGIRIEATVNGIFGKETVLSGTIGYPPSDNSDNSKIFV